MDVLGPDNLDHAELVFTRGISGSFDGARHESVRAARDPPRRLTPLRLGRPHLYPRGEDRARPAIQCRREIAGRVTCF